MKEYKDFYYNGHNASDFHLIAVRSEDDTGSFGLSRELIKTELNPDKNNVDIQGVKYSDTLSLKFLLLKNPCVYKSQKEMEINDEELEEINSWLMSPKHTKKLVINPSSCEIEYYGVVQEVTPYEQGNLYGFNVTFVCNAPYGYRVCYDKCVCSDEVQKYLLNRTNEYEEYIYPVVTLHPTSVGTYTVKNISDNNNTLTVTLKEKYEKVVIDCNARNVVADGKIIPLSDIGWNLQELIDWNGVSTGICKLYWLRLLPGENSLRFSGNGTFEITYRIPVMTGGY